ncbi:MAG: TIGR04283 family arsenosugar biosynthesis glycosyltransferase [Cyanobacteriota bacterium]
MTAPRFPGGGVPPLNPRLSVVVPVRNEAARLPVLLAALNAAAGLVAEVLVVDGGSSDGSGRVAQLAGARLLRQSGGRGAQIAAGVAAAAWHWLLLLNGDATLPRGWDRAVIEAMAQGSGAWYFELAIAAPQPLLRLVERAVALRSRWRQLPYGDQGLLLPAALLARCGGVKPLPLMEDLDLAERLRQFTRLRSLGLPLRVDGRRWQRLGVWRTGRENGRLRRAWRRGANPELLARMYYRQIPTDQTDARLSP